MKRLGAELLVAWLFAAVLVAGGCEVIAPAPPDPELVKEAPDSREPPRVVVQHCLIATAGVGVPGVTRTPEEAERLARTVLQRARAGEDFTQLVRLNSDDLAGDGQYRVANFGVPTADGDEVERRVLVKGLGNAAFKMAPGEFALVPYDELTSPLGWHVVKRLE